MAAHRAVHPLVEHSERERVRADQLWGEFGDPGARAARVGREVRGAQRTHLAPPGEPLVGIDRHDGRVEHRHRVAARPFVAPLVQREVDLEHPDAGDPHAAAAAFAFEEDQSVALV